LPVETTCPFSAIRPHCVMLVIDRHCLKSPR
jgi:hypothetical protein